MVSVVDGDTLVVLVDDQREVVRLIGINAPEHGRDPECFGEEAAAFAAALLPAGATVLLERDVTDRDQFGRLLRYVWTTDGTFVNDALVRGGYARVSTFPPDVRWTAALLEAERAARETQTGLWGACQRDETTEVPLEIVAVIGAPPGGRAMVVAQTAPHVLCTIEYVTPAGTRSQASGLGARRSDDGGRVMWTWNIGPSTRPGIGRVTVSCGAAQVVATIAIAPA